MLIECIIVTIVCCFEWIWCPWPSLCHITSQFTQRAGTLCGLCQGNNLQYTYLRVKHMVTLFVSPSHSSPFFQSNLSENLYFAHKTYFRFLYNKNVSWSIFFITFQNKVAKTCIFCFSEISWIFRFTMLFLVIFLHLDWSSSTYLQHTHWTALFYGKGPDFIFITDLFFWIALFFF